MFWCISISRPIASDNVRDMLLQTAYLMIKFGNKQKKFRSHDCEGVVKTTFKSTSYVGTSGILFEAVVECEEGKINVMYLVRDKNLQILERVENGAWLSPDEILSGDIPPEKLRPNPVRRVAHSCN